jgi:hypothetical protein
MLKRRGKKHNHPTNVDGSHEHLHTEGHGPVKNGMARNDSPEGIRLGVVLNGKIVETISANNQYASMFMSQPTFIDITEEPDLVVGSIYEAN